MESTIECMICGEDTGLSLADMENANPVCSEVCNDSFIDKNVPPIYKIYQSCCRIEGVKAKGTYHPNGLAELIPSSPIQSETEVSEG